jgi:DNA-binding NtrC family response regulator
MKKTGRILVVDDNTGILRTMEILLRMYFAEVKTLPSPVQLHSVLSEYRPHVVLLDMNFNDTLNTGNEGLYWIDRIHSLAPATEVVLFTAYADIRLAVEGMKRGAFDFIVKPWDNNHLQAVLTAARDKALQRGKNGPDLQGEREDGRQEMFWGNSETMRLIRATVEKIAPTDAAVLIIGENGTGKDMLAREIHALSRRSAKAMVAVDAGAIPDTLFESELFGHRKGAFTDAHNDHTGLFEQADQSTLFLDEIGNIPLHLQPKLLRALQNRSITRLGDTKPRSVDIRLVCATNSPIDDLVRSGQFREDLFYRINTIRLNLPPLRERQEDIVPLAQIFLRRYAERYHRQVRDIGSDAARLLVSQPWHGNIRELQNCIEKAVILSETTELTPADLQLSAPDPGNNEPAVTFLADNEERLIRQAMEKTDGNISATARMLGISRPTLYAKLRKYGL